MHKQRSKQADYLQVPSSCLGIICRHLRYYMQVHQSCHLHLNGGGQNGQLIFYVPTCMYSLTGYLPQVGRYLSACVGDFLSSLRRSVLRLPIGYVLFRCENFRPEGMQVYHYSFILKRGMGMHRGTRQALRFLTDWQKINAQVFSGCGQSGKYHILPERWCK